MVPGTMRSRYELSTLLYPDLSCPRIERVCLGRSRSLSALHLSRDGEDGADKWQLVKYYEINNLDEADLSVRLEYVEKLNQNFEQSVSFLEETSDVDMDDTIRSNFMTSYFEVTAKLKRKLGANTNQRAAFRSSTLRQFSVDEPVTVRKTRLPELRIPQFSGSYTEWPAFFAMFSTAIASDMDLSNLEKFQHLKTSLTGAALDTISSLEPTDSNYEKAIDLLKNRFDNKLLLFQTHIKEIFGLHSVDKNSALSLRQLSDKLNAHVRALDTICSKEQMADGLLIYLITSKLDLQSLAKWEEHLHNDKLPSWDSLSSFLDRRCRMLENLESSIKPKSPNHQVNKKTNFHGRNVLIASGATQMCTFCEAKDHYITTCQSFEKLSPTLRFKESKRLNLCLNCLRKGHRLWKCKSGTCRFCHLKHHTLLHIGNNDLEINLTNPQDKVSVAHEVVNNIEPKKQSTLVSSSSNQNISHSVIGSRVLLATAIVLVKNKFGVYVPCRAILDSASQLNFITSRFANLAQLKVKHSNVYISGIGEGSINADKIADVEIKSHSSSYSVSFSAVVIPAITDYQPNIDNDVSKFKIPENIKLADEGFYKRSRIDLLIGAGLFFELMSVGQIRCGNISTILQKTHLGWIVSGGGVLHSKAHSLAATCMVKPDTDSDSSLIDILKSFWEIENNFANSEISLPEHKFCEEHFAQNTIQLPSGEYSVSLPKKLDTHMLGDSYDRALHRFKNLEKKLSKMPDTKKKYVDFMKEYLDLQHMSLVKNIPQDTRAFFLPHHCVQKEDSTTTKLRVVFDGSAKSTSGISLNDILYAGPTIQPKLFNTLLRFRLFRVALSGDISKMYRCVRVNPPDDYLQCILWRNNTEEDIQVYKLDTVTYGTKPAAFLAIRTMQQLSIDTETSFPIGAQVIRRDFYVDDLISGANSIEEVVTIREQVTALLKR
ncbi:uncharacterized protein LOC133323837, partial [Musca vetustissima]|uniref:uncharacterized protein LOC133323837 n=1 Tax=Musca vetustissima TaxID=27455 RepID=UPI002AB6A4C2